jgi:hypothetical protein
MNTKHNRNYVVIPSSVILTPKVVIGVTTRFSTNKIRDVVQAGIEELDRRSGDPDFEPDFDAEAEWVV